MIENKEIISVTDFTLLEENVSDEKLYSFFEKYLKMVPSPAAFCVYPEDVYSIYRKYSKELSEKTPCVVVNFPNANQNFDAIESQIIKAGNFSAEVDVVFPSRVFLKEKNEKKVRELLLFYKKCIIENDLTVVKVIMESSMFDSQDDLINAYTLVYEILYSKRYKLLIKTSTGKIYIDEDHTLAISSFNKFYSLLPNDKRKYLGFKISGGVRNRIDYERYASMLICYDELVQNNLFRVGASSLIDNL
jgi:deoxyribose-phosphate aldolase